MNIRGKHYADGRPISIDIEAGVISRIEPLAVADNGAGNLSTIAPGLIDLQINGYAGRDFNGPLVAENMVGEAARLLWAQGVTSFFPTIITNSDASIAQALAAICRARDADSVVRDGVPGIHLEGPFISPEGGPRGAHPLEFVRPPDWELFCRWQELAGGMIRIVTMSPHWPESPAFIERCTAAGVVVSIGHTSASAEQISDAVKAGATLSTHFGNAAHLMLPRHPNYLWEQLAHDELWATLIADGFHLPDQVLKVAMRVKQHRAMLVSDAVSLAGMPPGEYQSPVGGRVVLSREGRLHLAKNEKLLAGSAQMLLQGIDHLVRRGLADFSTAWEMASIRPATFMRLPTAAGLAIGTPGDLVLLEQDDGKIRVTKIVKAGQCVYP